VLALAASLGAMRINGAPLPKETIDAKLAELTG
jgi:hypothetical protein